MYLLWWSDIEAHRVLARPPVFYYFFLQIFFKNFKTEHSQTLLRKCKSKTIPNFSANNFFSDITITKHPNIVLIKKLIKSNEFGVKFLLLKDKIYTQRQEHLETANGRTGHLRIYWRIKLRRGRNHSWQRRRSGYILENRLSLFCFQREHSSFHKDQCEPLMFV